jgi:hypothetical protein
VFTARYALSPYIKQIRFVFKGLREEHRPRVFENRVLREAFGPKTGRGKKEECRKLHSEELLVKYYVEDKLRRMGWAKHVARR